MKYPIDSLHDDLFLDSDAHPQVLYLGLRFLDELALLSLHPVQIVYVKVCLQTQVEPPFERWLDLRMAIRRVHAILRVGRIEIVISCEYGRVLFKVEYVAVRDVLVHDQEILDNLVHRDLGLSDLAVLNFVIVHNRVVFVGVNRVKGLGGVGIVELDDDLLGFKGQHSTRF